MDRKNSRIWIETKGIMTGCFKTEVFELTPGKIKLDGEDLYSMVLELDDRRANDPKPIKEILYGNLGEPI